MSIAETFIHGLDDVPDDSLILFEVEENAVAGYKPGVGFDNDNDDLGPFRAANRTGRLRTKDDYVVRAELIRRQFPSMSYTDGQIRRIFDERPEVFRALLKVLAEIDAAEDLRPGRAGRRPNLGFADGSRRLLRLFGREYSTLVFAEAFAVLCRDRSQRAVVAKTGLAKTRVVRLLRAELEPTGADMEAVARGFSVHPAYFVEWRTAFVVAAICDRMNVSPETSLNVYARLVSP